MMFSEALIVDDGRSACLCAEGGQGYVAATVVDDDGHVHYVVALVASINDPGARVDVSTAGVAHEQLGALPPRWRDRTRLCPTRCGRPTKTGGQCKRIVGTPGKPCASHRSARRKNHRKDNVK